MKYFGLRKFYYKGRSAVSAFNDIIIDDDISIHPLKQSLIKRKISRLLINEYSGDEQLNVGDKEFQKKSKKNHGEKFNSFFAKRKQYLLQTIYSNIYRKLARGSSLWKKRQSWKMETKNLSDSTNGGAMYEAAS